MRTSTIVGGLVIGSASLLSLGILPILLGGLEQSGQLSKAGIGQVAMLELFGLALGAAVGGFWMGRGAMRLKATTVSLALAAINIATVHAGTTVVVMMDRAGAGILAGLLCGLANAIIVRSKQPGRLTGALVGGSMTPGVALAYLIPVFLIPKFGVAAGFYVLAAGAFIASLFAITLEDKLTNLERPTRTWGRLGGPVSLFTGTIVLQSCGLGAAWMYIDRLAHQNGFGPSVVGLAIACSLAAQILAAWVSAWLEPKVPRRSSLFMLIAAQAAFTALSIVTGSPAIFIVSVSIFGGATAAMQAFQVAEMIALDPTRRTGVLVGPMILFGCGLGPLIASFLTTESDVRSGAWAAVAMTAGSALLYVACVRRSAVPHATALQVSR